MTTYTTFIDAINATNGNSMGDLIVNVDQASGNVLGLLLVITIFVGYYLIFSKQQNIDDLLASSFTTTIITFLLMLANIVAWQIFIGTMFLFIGTFLLKWYLS